jgi:glycosyltransferase involved in cell wall biosynthesis
MHVALYAPMKPPDDPRPSGDRQAVRMILAALARAGHSTEVASRLVSWLPAPDPAADAGLRTEATAEVETLVERWRTGGADRPDLFLTYHLYHRAPDRIGPAVAARLGIPFVVIEASRALKRAVGPWAERFREVDAALAAADAVAAIHAEDAEGLAAMVDAPRLHRLAPFLDAAPFRKAAAGRVSPSGPMQLLAVGMMRPGDKARSYAVLAEALARLGDRPWHLSIVGDGPARPEVEAAFATRGLAGDRITFRGARASEAMPAVYADADVLVWPAINEAYGFVFLEAQAAGLPVVGARRGGVPEIVRDGETGLLAPEGDAAAFAECIATLLSDPSARARMGAAAADHIATRHDLPVAARSLDAILAAAVVSRNERSRCGR